MKNKALLTMIEFVIMFLVFAVISALCLQVFSYANNISIETTIRDDAIIEAQNIAELLEYHKGDISAVNPNFLSLSDGKWEMKYETFTLRISLSETTTPLLETRVITVIGKNGQIFGEIPVSWQKEGVR